MDATISANRSVVRGMLDAINDGVLLVRRDYKIIYQNASFSQLYGNLVGETCFRALHGRQSPCAECLNREVCKDGRPRRKARRLKLRDGTSTWVETCCSPFKNGAGRLVGAIEVIRDITEQKKAEVLLEEALKERNMALERLQGDLLEAAKYIRNGLPEPLSSGPVRTDWRFFPSASVGGDTFGYHWIDSAHFAIYLIDVSGHGVGAALLSVSISNVLRTRTLADTDYRKPQEVLAALNRTFPGEEHNHMFFTAWYGVYNVQSRTLEFASAGHPPALLLHELSSNRIETKLLRTANPAIGVDEGVAFKSKSIPFGPSSRLYIFSDGVFEISQKDGTFWGFKKFMDFVTHSMNFKSSILKQLTDHAFRLTPEGNFNDDFTILELGVDG